MARQTFHMKVSGSVRVKGPIVTDSVSASVANVVVASVRARISAARNLSDGPTKPLNAAYAKWKSKSVKYNKTFRYKKVWAKAYQKPVVSEAAYQRLFVAVQNRRIGQGVGRPIRDLYLSGEMLNNLSIRKATPRQITYALTARGPRMKAVSNAKKEDWLGFSPVNEKDVSREAAARIAERVAHLVVKHQP